MNPDEIKEKIQQSIEQAKKKFLGFADSIKSKLPGSAGKGSRDLEDEIDDEYEDDEYYDDEVIDGDVDELENTDASLSFDADTGSIDPIRAVQKARDETLGLNDPIDDDRTGEIDVEAEYEDEEYEDDEEYEEDEGGADDEKAAQKQKFIRYGIGLVIGYLALDIMFPDEEKAKNPKSKTKVTRSSKSKKKGTKGQKQKRQAKKQSEKKADEIKEISVTKGTGKVKPTTMKVKPEITAIDEPTNEIPTEVEPKPVEKSIGDVYIDDPNAGMKDVGFETGRKEGQIINNKVPLKIKEIEISNDLGKILDRTKEQVKRNVEYVAPPDYTKYGRGLVYNCKGKHWACIDRTRWFECKKNLKYTDFYGKNKECYTVNVYGTQKDCRVMQLHKINTNSDNSFCQ